MTIDAPARATRPLSAPDEDTTLVVSTPVGTLTLRANASGLTYLELPPEDPGPEPSIREAARTSGRRTPTGEPDEILAAAAAQLDEYFAGRRRQFDLPLELGGTPFQRSVWLALADIGYGETISYAELAQRVGRPAAFRAVGQANGANPIPIVLPCHRVVASGGGIGGYGGGLTLKRRLLALEGAELEG